MPPVASTSRAIPSTPTAAAETTTPRRSQLSRKGKERAIYTPPTYDFDDPEQGLYQPRSGQLQRKKKQTPKSKLSRRRGGGGGGGTSLGVETIKIGAAIEKVQPVEEEEVNKRRDKKRKREASATKTKRNQEPRPPFPTSDVEPSSQPNPPTSPSVLVPERKRKRPREGTKPDKERKEQKRDKKKTVRLEVPVSTDSLNISASSSSSDNEFGTGDNDTFRLESDLDADNEANHRRLTSRRKRSRLRSRSHGAALGRDAKGGQDEDREEGDEGDLVDEDEMELSLDYANPLNLPLTSLGNQQRRTSRKYWRGLEYGVYRSALHDAVVGGENDLAKLVWEWEELTRERKREEEREREARLGLEGDDEREGTEEEEGRRAKRGRGRPRLPRKPKLEKRSGTVTPGPKRRTRSNTTGYSSATGVGDGDGQDAEGSVEKEEDEEEGLPTLALPTSATLGSMARWPLYPDDLTSYSMLSGQRYDLHEELEVLAEQTRRCRHLTTETRRRPRKIPSAYSTTGPLSSGGAEVGAVSSSSEGSDLESDSSSSFSTSTPPLPYPPSFLRIPATITSLLNRLVDFVPKEPLPALDIWSVKTREEGLRIEREATTNSTVNKDKKGKGKEVQDAENVPVPSTTRQKETVPGWREVVAVARENESIPEHVVNQLEQQLIEMYGQTFEEAEPIEMPPIGGMPAFPKVEPRAPRVRKKRIKKAIQTEPNEIAEQREAAIDPTGDQTDLNPLGPTRSISLDNSELAPTATQTVASASSDVPNGFPTVAMDIDEPLELPIPPAHYTR